MTQHPEINCVMTAQCPHVTAYAITTNRFDSHTIPESYILLRDMPMIPFKTLYANPQEVAETVSWQNPVLLVQNDCVLAVGESILQSFDRLEVAEYSARALIDTARIGDLVPIGTDDILRLKEAFNLVG